MLHVPFLVLEFGTQYATCNIVMFRRLVYQLILFFLARFGFWLLTDLTVHGRENLPAKGPYIVIANHFSLFEIPLIAMVVPQAPIFIAAQELAENIFLDVLMWANDSIRITRGRADRQSLKQSLNVLAEGKVLAIFPEGGISAEAIELAAQGISTMAMPNTREKAELLPARSGISFIAVQSGAPILPIAILGTEHLEGNLKRLKRTKVDVYIGEPFGPLEISEGVRGRAKRVEMDALSHEMMGKIAEMLPEENRGYYR